MVRLSPKLSPARVRTVYSQHRLLGVSAFYRGRSSRQQSLVTAPMSVLVVSHASNIWGAERRLLELAPLLGDEGIYLTLAAPPCDFVDAWADAGHETLILELPPHQGLRQTESRHRPGLGALVSETAVVMRSCVAIGRIARRFDVVQSHSLWANLEVALAGALTHRPVLLDLHDIVEEGIGRRVLRMTARVATITLANSAATAQTVGGTGSKVRIVHPGVDTTRFHPGPADPVIRAQLTSCPDALLIGILGRIDPEKGIDLLVEAMGRPDNKLGEVHLAIIGGGHAAPPVFVETIRNRAAMLFGGRVRFIAPRDDVPDVLRALDVVVNASHCEPFGRTILEAQACGVPVVATAAGGVPEFVKDGETGLLVPPFDVPSLEAALERLVADSLLRRKLSEQGAAQAVREFSLGGQAQAAATVYRLAAASASKS